MRRYDEAIATILDVRDRVPRFMPARIQLARAYGELDRIAEAKAEIAAIRKLAPNYTMASAFRMFTYRDEENRARLRDGLRKAGLPE